MSIKEACQWLQDQSFPTNVRESDWLFPTLETIHVFALVLVIGSIFMVDLRLMGVANRSRPVTELTAQALPLTWSAFAVAACAGLLLFSSKAVTYYGDIPFRVKMICMACAGLNMACFQRLTYPHVAQWNTGPTPWRARLAGAVSLVLWICIVAMGRWIGFTT